MKEANIRKLIEIFQESGVEELEYQESFWRGIRLKLSRNRRVEGATTVALQAPAGSAPVTAPALTAPAAAPVPESAADDGLHSVTSPMVGTFYRSPSPEAESFVNIGDHVKTGQTICIIEAMKIMNEIPSDAEGEVVALLIDSGEPVEFGQPLFKIHPSS